MLEVKYEEFIHECMSHSDIKEAHTMCWCHVQGCKFLSFCFWRQHKYMRPYYGFKLSKIDFDKCKLIYSIEEKISEKT